MKTVSTLAEFWETYFIKPARIVNSDAWNIVFMTYDNGAVLVSLANPFTEEHEELFISTVAASDLATFTMHYKQRWLSQLPARFGLHHPNTQHVLTEYPDWQTFFATWIQEDPQLLQANMPLLFDYPSAQEYRAMQLKNTDYAGYRRLMVVIYQYRKQQFLKVFIKNVDDIQFQQIYDYVFKLYHTSMSQLITLKRTA